MSEHLLPKQEGRNPRPEPEIVLLNGVFVKLHRIKWFDWATACQHPQSFMPIILAARCCRFDGDIWTPEKIQQMDAEDFFPLLNLINAQIVHAQKNKDGVA